MQVVADLLGAVPKLAGRIHSAARFAQLLAANQLPQNTPAAFVLPLGLRGRSAEAATGMFVQSLDRLVGVVLVVRVAGDATGAAGLVELEPLIEATIRAIAGADAGDAIGTFTLVRGELVTLAAGAITYQLDFSIEDQLRITR